MKEKVYIDSILRVIKIVRAIATEAVVGKTQEMLS